MMKSYRSIVVVIAFLVCIAFLLIYVSIGNQSRNTNAEQSEKQESAPTAHLSAVGAPSEVKESQTGETAAAYQSRKEQQIRSAFRTPIRIYGKVVDQDGVAIPDATVEIGVNDKPMMSGSKYTRTTNESGHFELSNKRGLSYSLTASKEGYYTFDQSRMGRNVATSSQRSSADNPVVLTLYEKKNPVELIRVRSGQVDVSKTGEPVTVDLATGRRSQEGLEIRSWIEESSERKFDWKYQLAVPGGGLVENTESFDFVAPVNGYQQSLEITMAADADRWTSDVKRSFFAKLPTGKYGRFTINFYAGQKRNFVVIESRINPTAGDPNLEDLDSRLIR